MKKLLFSLCALLAASINAMEESQSFESKKLVIIFDGKGTEQDLFAGLSSEDHKAVVTFFDDCAISAGETKLSDFSKKVFEGFSKNVSNQLEIVKKEAKFEERNNLLEQLKNTQDGKKTDEKLKEAFESHLKHWIKLEKQKSGSFPLFQEVYSIREQDLLDHILNKKEYTPLVGHFLELIKERFQSTVWSEITEGVSDLEKVNQNARDRVSNLHKSILKAVENGQVGSHLDIHVKSLKEKFSKENIEEKKEDIKELVTSKKSLAGFGTGMAFMGLLWAGKTWLSK